MEGGDLESWGQSRSIIVLEGAIAVPSYTEQRRKLVRVEKVLDPPEKWSWSVSALLSINDKAYRLSIPIDVVTFISQEVADAAAEYFLKYGVEVSSVDYVDFDQFCATLAWRHDVDYVYDADPSRFQRYGQRGFAVQGGHF